MRDEAGSRLRGCSVLLTMVLASTFGPGLIPVAQTHAWRATQQLHLSAATFAHN